MERDSIEAHTCELCQAVTLHWCRLENANGYQHYFCDHECVLRWIERQHENVYRESLLEFDTIAPERRRR